AMGDGGNAPRSLMIRGLGLCSMANAGGNEPGVLMPATRWQAVLSLAGSGGGGLADVAEATGGQRRSKHPIAGVILLAAVPTRHDYSAAMSQQVVHIGPLSSWTSSRMALLFWNGHLKPLVSGDDDWRY